MMPCASCSGSGEFDVPEPPRWFATADAHRAIDAAQLARNGILPAGGGWLDQTQNFIDSVGAVWSDEAWAEGEMRKARG